MSYEFYIFSKEGDEVWQWDMHQTDKVINDIKEMPNIMDVTD